MYAIPAYVLTCVALTAALLDAKPLPVKCRPGYTAPAASAPPATVQGPALPSADPTKITFTGCLKPGQFVLTFDDGPASGPSDTVLDVLKEKNVKAAFFVLGSSISTPEGAKFAQRAYAEGHDIASHSWDHPDFATISDAEALKQLTNTGAAIKNAIGKDVNFFRFPYGSSSPFALQYLADHQMSYIYWSMDTMDYSFATASEINDAYVSALSRTNSKTDNFISLNHDIHATTAANLPDLINLVQSHGYTIVSMSECIGMPAYKQ